MLTGFISIKVVAVIIGPTGIALLGQLNNFTTMITTVASGGMNTGITKYVSEAKESNNKIKLFLSTAAQSIIILSIFISIILIFFAGYFSKIILLDKSYTFIFRIFGMTLILFTLNGYLRSVLNGFKEFKRFVHLSIISSIISVFFVIGLVLFWQLKGALISAVSFQGFSFFVTLLMVRRSPWFSYKNFTVRFSKIILKKYLKFSLMSLVTAFIVPGSQLFIRSYVIANISPSEAGIWQGMTKISGMYLTMITSSFGIYYLPRLSEIKNSTELRKEIFTAYIVIIPVLLISFSGIYIFRDFIIHVLFSSEFIPMRRLFVWQLIGDLFSISSWLLGYVMIAKSMARLYIITEVIFTVTFIGLSLLLLRNHDVVGITQAYMINSIISFMFMAIIFRNLIFNRDKEIISN